MSITKCSPYSIRAEQDDRGQRDYWVTYLVETSTPYQCGLGDGPRTIGFAVVGPGTASCLPSIGDSYSFGNDSDPWAICHPNRVIKPHQQNSGDPIQAYLVDILFSTKPLKRCMSTTWDDPLMEPQKISGGFKKYTIEATKDRNGNLLRTSSHEMIRGPQVEFDSSHPTVRIEQNVPSLELALCSSMMDHLNDDTLWNLAARRIKLSNFTWEEKWYDICSYYYTRVFEFEIRNNEDDLFDRNIVDEGTKVLNGRWVTIDDPTDTGTSTNEAYLAANCGLANLWKTIPICGEEPDHTNPQHFIRYKDLNGENARVILNGEGKPAATSEIVYYSPGSDVYGTGNTGDSAVIQVEYYPESDFTVLGIPTTIDFGTGSL